MKKIILTLIIILLVIAVIVEGYFLSRKENNREDIFQQISAIGQANNTIREDYLNVLDENRALQYHIESLVSRLQTVDEPGYYLVIDTQAKKFQIRKGQMIIREGQCAVGKGYTSCGNRQWNFQTPTGERRITSKNKNPDWHRPDWYWQERGSKVPDDFITFSPNMPADERKEAYKLLSRREREYVRSVPGELGRYSLGLGDGYYIHYGRGLGTAASHGCIRVGSADLEAIFKVLEIGDPVFIY